VFAGNYPDNPGSVFGHTFLKVTSSENSRLQFAEGKSSSHLDILDYAINYAAYATDEIGFVYAFKGLFGGYYGYFSMDPYYQKVNDYSEGEGRDLWEYRLNFSREDATFLLSHFWELKNSALMNYYFLDDNCSLMILALIEVAKPEWNLVAPHPLVVVPLETIKKLKAIPGAIQSVQYRPSIRKRSDENFASLSSAEKSEVKKLIRGKLSPLKSRSEKALYTSSLYYFSKRSFLDGKLSATEDKILSESLTQLSRLPEKIRPQTHDGKDPVASHDLKEVGLSAGLNNDTFLDLTFKFGIHDLMDYERGYLENSELNLAQTKLRFQDQKLFVRESNIVTVGLLRPLSLNNRHFSWRGKVTYDGLAYLGCRACRSVKAEALGGVSFTVAQDILGYVMAGPYATTFDSSLIYGSAGLSAETGLYHRPDDHWKLLLILSYYLDFARSMDQSLFTNTSLGITYHPEVNWDVNLRVNSPVLFLGARQANAYEQMLGVDYHF
jgi:hypothetical protein